jgi:hypothetical protein
MKLGCRREYQAGEKNALRMKAIINCIGSGALLEYSP